MEKQCDVDEGQGGAFDAEQMVVKNPLIAPGTENVLEYLGGTERNERYLKEGTTGVYVITEAVVEASAERIGNPWRVRLTCYLAVSADRVFKVGEILARKGTKPVVVTGEGTSVASAFGDALAKLKDEMVEKTVLVCDATGMFGERTDGGNALLR